MIMRMKPQRDPVLQVVPGVSSRFYVGLAWAFGIQALAVAVIVWWWRTR